MLPWLVCWQCHEHSEQVLAARRNPFSPMGRSTCASVVGIACSLQPCPSCSWDLLRGNLICCAHRCTTFDVVCLPEELRFSTAGALVQAVEYISEHLDHVSTPFLVFHSNQVRIRAFWCICFGLGPFQQLVFAIVVTLSCVELDSGHSDLARKQPTSLRQSFLHRQDNPAVGGAWR